MSSSRANNNRYCERELKRERRGVDINSEIIKSQWGKALVEGIQKPAVPDKGEDMIGDDGFGTTEHALKSAREALWTIANMQITENTDKSEVLELCVSIARIELEKCSPDGK